MRKFGQSLALALVLAMSGCTATAPIAFAGDAPFWLCLKARGCR